MSNASEPWFVKERSESLAAVLFTARSDVRVLKERLSSEGTADFLVQIEAGDPLSTPQFIVEIKGTTSSNSDEWMPSVKHLFRRAGSKIYVPVCVVVVNVRDNEAVYAWVAEPQVEPKRATLRFHEKGAFRPLDAAAVDEIVDRVKAWYDVLPHQLIPA